MTKTDIQNQFMSWVRTHSGAEPAKLQELVQACLDDAIEQCGEAFAKNAADPARKEEQMKQLLDYWSSNVYMIMERGATTDLFRGLRQPDNATKNQALKSFYALRDACYASYFSKTN